MASKVTRHSWAAARAASSAAWTRSSERSRGEHLARLDRLDQIAVGARLQGLGAVAAVDVDGGDVQDRRGDRGRVRLEAAADLEAGQVG